MASKWMELHDETPDRSSLDMRPLNRSGLLTPKRGEARTAQVRELMDDVMAKPGYPGTKTAEEMLTLLNVELHLRATRNIESDSYRFAPTTWDDLQEAEYTIMPADLAIILQYETEIQEEVWQ